MIPDEHEHDRDRDHDDRAKKKKNGNNDDNDNDNDNDDNDNVGGAAANNATVSSSSKEEEQVVLTSSSSSSAAVGAEKLVSMYDVLLIRRRKNKDDDGNDDEQQQQQPFELFHYNYSSSQSNNNNIDNIIIGNNRFHVFLKMNLQPFVEAISKYEQEKIVQIVYDLICKQCIDVNCQRAGKFLVWKQEQKQQTNTTATTATATAATSDEHPTHYPLYQQYQLLDNWQELTVQQAKSFILASLEKEQDESTALVTVPATTTTTHTTTLAAAAAAAATTTNATTGSGRTSGGGGGGGGDGSTDNNNDADNDNADNNNTNTTSDEEKKRRRRSSLLRRSLSNGDMLEDQKKRSDQRNSYSRRRGGQRRSILLQLLEFDAKVNADDDGDGSNNNGMVVEVQEEEEEKKQGGDEDDHHDDRGPKVEEKKKQQQESEDKKEHPMSNGTSSSSAEENETNSAETSESSSAKPAEPELLLNNKKDGSGDGSRTGGTTATTSDSPPKENEKQAHSKTSASLKCVKDKEEDGGKPYRARKTVRIAESNLPPSQNSSSSNKNNKKTSRPTFNRLTSWTSPAERTAKTIFAAEPLDVLLSPLSSNSYRLLPNHTGNNRIDVMVQIKLTTYMQILKNDPKDKIAIHAMCREMVETVQTHYKARFLVEQKGEDFYLSLTDEQAIAAIACIFSKEAAERQTEENPALLPDLVPGGREAQRVAIANLKKGHAKKNQRTAMERADTLEERLAAEAGDLPLPAALPTRFASSGVIVGGKKKKKTTTKKSQPSRQQQHRTPARRRSMGEASSDSDTPLPVSFANQREMAGDVGQQAEMQYRQQQFMRANNAPGISDERMNEMSHRSFSSLPVSYAATHPANFAPGNIGRMPPGMHPHPLDVRSASLEDPIVDASRRSSMTSLASNFAHTGFRAASPAQQLVQPPPQLQVQQYHFQQPNSYYPQMPMSMPYHTPMHMPPALAVAPPEINQQEQEALSSRRSSLSKFSQNVIRDMMQERELQVSPIPYDVNASAAAAQAFERE